MNQPDISTDQKRSLIRLIADLIFPLRRRLTRYKFPVFFTHYPDDGQMISVTDGRFESQGDDPKLIVGFKTIRRPGGDIRVRLLGQPATGAARPILYLARDSGPAAWQGVPLPPLSADKTQPWAIIDAPKASFNLRLDPLDRPGTFDLEGLEITTLGIFDRLVRWMWSGWHRQLTGYFVPRSWPMVWCAGNNLRSGAAGQLISAGRDPFVLLYPLKDLRFGDVEGAHVSARSRPYPSGWVEIDIAAKVTQGRLAPELFIDTGDGFDRHPAIVFDQFHAAGARVFCWLPAGICRLRLDPFADSGELHVEAITIRTFTGFSSWRRRGMINTLTRALLNSHFAAFWRLFCSARWVFDWRAGDGLTVAENGDWVSQSLDPYFLLYPRHDARIDMAETGTENDPVSPCFPTGWVSVRLSAESRSGDLAPELYVDTGDGFDAQPPIDLTAAGLSDAGKLCWLPPGIRRLRLDTLGRFGAFSISEVRITELNHVTAAWRLLREGGQAAFPRRHDPLSHPLGLETLVDLEHRVTPLPVVRDDCRPMMVNILLPTLDASIVFGGYIAVFNFIVKLRHWGYATRIILCDSDHVDFDVLQAKLSRFPGVAAAISESEFAFAGTRGGEIRASGQDVFVAFSVWTGLLAQFAGQAIDQQRFVFFIQEDERIFYENNSYRAIADQVYKLPHVAIFNSALLQDYFRSEKLGVFSAGAAAGDAASVSYRHAITAIPQPSVDDLRRAATRTLFFYARPESHAARNLFEIGVLALRQAIDNGVFGPEWRFIAIGSLGLSGDLPLSAGRVLEISTRVDPESYAKRLIGCDIGLSLMYAPHPSVPPLEMASAGMSVVTTTYGRRDQQAMQALSSNIIAVSPEIGAVGEGLRQAVERTADLTARVAGAKVAWPTDWNDSFNATVETAVRRLLDAVSTGK